MKNLNLKIKFLQYEICGEKNTLPPKFETPKLTTIVNSALNLKVSNSEIFPS